MVLQRPKVSLLRSSLCCSRTNLVPRVSHLRWETLGTRLQPILSLETLTCQSTRCSVVWAGHATRSLSCDEPKQPRKLTIIPSWHLLQARKCHAENVTRSTREKFSVCAFVLAQQQETDVIWRSRKSLTISFWSYKWNKFVFDMFTSTTRWSVISLGVNIAQNCLYGERNWNSRL